LVSLLHVVAPVESVLTQKCWAGWGNVSYRFRGCQDLVVPSSRKPRPGYEAPGKGGRYEGNGERAGETPALLKATARATADPLVRAGVKASSEKRRQDGSVTT
jgi:hypothetical protein